MSIERSNEYASKLTILGEKGSTRWKLAKTGLWAAGGLIAAVALLGSWKIGLVAAVLGGAVGYKRDSVKTT